MSPVRFAYINRLTTMWRGRVLHDVPLPGDELNILDLHIKRAIRRDQWYNPEELEVYMCTRFRLYWNSAYCLTEGCRLCDSPGYADTQAFHADTWP